MQISAAVFLPVSLESWLTIAAIIIGPLAALLIQKHLEQLRAGEERKVMVFRALMSNCANRMSQPYVQALNGIEVEFHGNVKIIEKWRSFIDHLNTPHDSVGDPNLTRWTERATERLNSLLLEMGESLGYHFDEVTLKRNAYYPIGWNTLELEQTKLRQAAVKVFEGEKPLKVELMGQGQS
jgi:hypothetical protein